MSWQEKLIELVEHRLGIRLPRKDPSGSLARFVEARARVAGQEGPEAYCESLARGGCGSEEFSLLVTVVTNGQTSFFRDPEQFEAVASFLRHYVREIREGRLHIWSAGCSTGEEPYSLAMLCHEEGMDAQILATDINAESLAVAERGIYGAWTLRNIRGTPRERHFEVSDSRFRVRERLRDAVRFTRHNLLRDPPPRAPSPDGRWQLIVCQNVFIYFAEPSIAQAVDHFASALARRGAFFVAASEALHRFSGPLVPTLVVNRLAYRHGRRTERAIPHTVAVPECPPAPAGKSQSASGPSSVPPSQARYGYDAAVALMGRGENTRVRELLASYVKEHPEQTVARMTLGNVHLREHHFEKAIEAYHQVQEADPLLAEAHFFLGVAHRKLGDLERAEQALRRTLFLEPDFFPASFLLAGVYERWGRLPCKHRMLLQTLEITERGEHRRLFASETAGLEATEMTPARIAQACRRQLGEEQGRIGRSVNDHEGTRR